MSATTVFSRCRAAHSGRRENMAATSKIKTSIAYLVISCISDGSSPPLGANFGTLSKRVSVAEIQLFASINRECYRNRFGHTATGAGDR
jgi:hypothetical protein